MKKIMKLMLAFVLMLVQVIPNVGAVMNNDNGVITINNTIAGKDYSVYQVLVLDSYDEESKGYVYKVDTESVWYDFITSNEIDGVYVNVDEENFVTWVENADVNEFATKALQYAKDNEIEPTKKDTATSTTVTFENLNLGYYLVDSSLGALCGLTTTKPSATINEKNSEPTIVKEVMENTIGKFTEGADKVNNASIGETVYYQTTITVGKGAENYVLYDIMSSGLTLNKTISVKLNGEALENTDYEIKYDVKDGDVTYTFVIEFNGELNVNDVILVEYNAQLNKDAVVGSNGNINETWLEYGDNHSTTHDTTTTYTYSFDLVKTTDTNTVLEGAKFKLYDAKTGGNEIAVVKVSEGVYRVAYGDEVGVEIEASIAKITGLDAGTYYLEETKNPDGYTKLLTRVEVTITDSNLDANVENNTLVSGGVQVINTTGNTLPETGGMGTVLFISIGSLMVVLFGVLLVTKLRISKMDI